MEIPSYDRPFSLQTNNLPFPQQSEGLRHRWQRWRNRPTFNRGYERIPESEVNEINAFEETSFNQPEPETVCVQAVGAYLLSDCVPFV